MFTIAKASSPIHLKPGMNVIGRGASIIVRRYGTVVARRLVRKYGYRIAVWISKRIPARWVGEVLTNPSYTVTILRSFRNVARYVERAREVYQTYQRTVGVVARVSSVLSAIGVAWKFARNITEGLSYVVNQFVHWLYEIPGVHNHLPALKEPPHTPPRNPKRPLPPDDPPSPFPNPGTPPHKKPKPGHPPEDSPLKPPRRGEPLDSMSKQPQDISHSRCTFKPRPLGKRFGRYDMTNCNFGTLLVRGFTQTSCNVGLKAYDANSFTTAPTYEDILNNMVRQSTYNRVAGYPARNVLVKSLTLKYQFANATNHGVWLEIFNLQCRMTASPTTLLPAVDPIPLFNIGRAREDIGNAGNFYGAFTEPGVPDPSKQKAELITESGHSLLSPQVVRRYWNCVKKQRIWLSPGEIHIHHTHHNMNFAMRTADYGSVTNEAQGDTALPWTVCKSITTYLVWSVEGKVGHLTGQPKGNVDTPTVLGGKVDVEVTGQFKVCELQPFHSRFRLPLSSDKYAPIAGYQGDRTTAEQIAVQAPADVTGD